jgi:hypothetical protein
MVTQNGVCIPAGRSVGDIDAVLRVFSSKPAAKLVLAALTCLLAAACSSGPASDSGIFSKPSSFFATPDWLKDTAPAEGALTRRVSPEDLAGADGRCAGAGIEVAPSGPEGEAAPRPDAPPVMAGGVGLGMSECEVIRRAGPGENFQIGTNDRGERTVTLTYIQGSRPGIYRFQAGRLTSIERAPESPAAARVAKPKPKPAAPRAAAVSRPQRAPDPPPDAVWPAPQPAAQPAPQPQQAPWPAPGRSAAPPQQSAPWPAPQSGQPPANSPWPAPAR